MSSAFRSMRLLACATLLSVLGAVPALSILTERLSWEAKLLANDGGVQDNFGRSVALSGTAALLGVPRDDDDGALSGSSYIFRFDGLTWVQEAKLLPHGGRVGSRFGSSGALWGDIALVGAWGHYNNRGAAYVFRHDGSSWVEEAKLLAENMVERVRFGYSVALYGDTALVGVPYDADSGFASGSVRVFRHDGSTWGRESRLLASDGESWDQFGHSVALYGDLALVGAVGDDDLGTDSGSAYLFKRNGTSWVEVAKLVARYGDQGDDCGASVALSGELALVGCRGADSNRGRSYLYRGSGSTWIEEATLTASDGSEADNFGCSVALAGPVALVGAYNSEGNDRISGSAYEFFWDGNAWSEVAKLFPSDGEPGDKFGFSVALSEDSALLGAPFDFDSGAYSGSAYVFSNRLFADGFESGDTSHWSQTIP